MENIKAEVNAKIRSAIKAKLMELGAYVDEELPDYIMVMVVNKRTREQMEEDLQLFLGSNTEHFTVWLHQVLQKLEEVTGLDKKALKLSILAEPETSERKRKTSAGSLDDDSHRKEKRRKSHEGKKAKKTVSEPDEGKEKKDVSSSVKDSVGDGNKPLDEGAVSSSTVAESEVTPVSKETPQDVNAEVKIVLTPSDVEDDDEDFINIKADAEAEALLNEELPKEATAVSSNPLTSPTKEGIPLCKGNQVPTKVVKVDVVAEPSSEPEKVEASVRTLDRKKKDSGGSKPSVAPLSERLARKRKLEKEGTTPSIRLFSQAMSIKDRLGLKKLENSEQPRQPPRLQDKLGSRTVAVESVKKLENSEQPRPGSRVQDRLGARAVAVEALKKLENSEQPRPGSRVQDRLGVRTVAAESVKKLENSEQPRAARRIQDRLGARAVAVEPVKKLENSEHPRPAPRIQDRLGSHPELGEPVKKKRIEPIVISPNVRNSSQAIEKTVRDRIYRRPPELDSANQDQKKRPILSRVVLPHPGREEEEYDPANPAVGTVASVVKVKPRPRLPAEMQANKNLLLKAVAEAQKSVAAAPIRPEPNALSHRNLPNSILDRRARVANVGITLPNRRAQSSIIFQKIASTGSQPSFTTASERLVLPASHSRDKITIHVSTDSAQSNSNSKGSLRQTCNASNIRYKNEELTLDAEQELNRSIEVSVENEEDMLPDEGIVTEETEIEEEVPAVYPPVGLASRMPRERPQPARSESPQFLVTLDGLDPNMFSSHSDDDQCVVHEEEDDDSSKVSSSPSPTLKVNKAVSPIVFANKDTSSEADIPKSLERCKFWPSCRLGDKCAFHHPSTPCKSFPKCSFRDKCLYIHPTCKFESSCTRKDCPFAHVSFSSVITPLVSISANRLKSKPGGSTQVCKFFPKCSNSLCPYLHPKPCRYGKFCSKPNCTYQHEQLPPVDKLKWTSPFRT